MLQFPQINAVAMHCGPLKIHWYGIMYLMGFAFAWCLGQYRAKCSQGAWTGSQVDDLVFYAGLGLILGGRIGYVLFYAYDDFFAEPISLFAITQGGMSFHGGLLGGIVACWLFARRSQKSFFQVTDFVAPLVPLGLAAGRLGNFINGELWGRVTTMPWGMLDPRGGPLPRHPSQLYELLLEGVLLFIIMWTYSTKPKPPAHVSGLFLLGYGCLRFGIEFFRQPDQQLGFVAFSWMTQGQLLCVPMVLFGLLCLLWPDKKGVKRCCG